jgi:hypothetical protein
MFKIHQTNMGAGFLPQTFTDLEDAIAYGRYGETRQPGTRFHAGGFEFTVWEGETLRASWSPLYGLRRER